MTTRAALALSATALLVAGCESNTLYTEGIPGFTTLESAYQVDVQVTQGGAPLWRDQQIVLSNIPDLSMWLPEIYRVYSVWLGPPPAGTVEERCAIYADIFDQAAATLAPIAKDGNSIFFAGFTSESEPTELATGGYEALDELWITGVTFHSNSLAAIDKTFDQEACVEAYGGEEPAEGEEPPPYPWFDNEAADMARSWWLGVQDEAGYLTVEVSDGGLEGHLTEYSLSQTGSDLVADSTGIIHDATFWAPRIGIYTDLVVP